MLMRITASRKTISKLKEKSNKASFNGDLKILKRAQAILMIFEGIKYKVISSTLGITEETIRVWFKSFLVKGLNFLNYKTSPGRPPKMTKTQKKKLSQIIDEGPEKYNFMGGCWRTPMIQIIIETEFGLSYSCHYLSRLLKDLGYSFQKATFVSSLRDHELRSKWLQEIWPKIMKEAEKKNSYVLFGDECSFTQQGSLSYTWSRIGTQPVVKSSASKRNYKVFGLIEYFTGKFFTMGYEGKLNSDSYQLFLEGVLSNTKKHLIIIQDGAKYHTSKEMIEFFDEKSKRITIYQLPTCSPDFNPIEKLWKKMKEKGTHLKYFPSFDSLVNKVNELMVDFTSAKNEVLALFGLYEKINFYNAFNIVV